MNEKEENSICYFQQIHEDCKYQSTIGGKFTWLHTPTGVGGIIVIRCNSCKQEENVTDWTS